jgi:hypothetical protein
LYFKKPFESEHQFVKQMKLSGYLKKTMLFLRVAK